MADIGSLLRETRIRNKIDITTVEEATKIRAKYLRALENEEWVVLPGPTYVKTFLRTYAQFLGLDPHLLVDEYSARFEEPEDLEVAAFARRRRVAERAQKVGPPRRGVGNVCDPNKDRPDRNCARVACADAAGQQRSPAGRRDHPDGRALLLANVVVPVRHGRGIANGVSGVQTMFRMVRSRS